MDILVSRGLVLFGLVAIICVILPLVIIMQNPYEFPCFYKDFDVSGKRKPDIDNLIEDYINNGGFAQIEQHHLEMQSWKDKNLSNAENSRLRRLRLKQYNASLVAQPFIFTMNRGQTRYRQRNYQRTAYRVKCVVEKKRYTYEQLLTKYKELEKIGFEATLKDYHSKEQRKLMTKELRQQIMERDNYTCRLCGKYMPDTVGLQIDHIIPVAKGGKSIPSNLQVLCSKCNGRKSDKLTK